MAPGVSELEVFSQLQAAAVENSASRRPRRATITNAAPPAALHAAAGSRVPGELYILDLGPAYR